MTTGIIVILVIAFFLGLWDMMLLGWFCYKAMENIALGDHAWAAVFIALAVVIIIANVQIAVRRLNEK